MRLTEFIAKISSTTGNSLPGDHAHLEMTPYKKGLSVKPESPRLSAVLILAYEKDANTELLLLKRAEYGGVHSAQVSFPGGKKDDTDADLRHTAIRELEEETGVRPDRLTIIRELSPMFIPPSNFLVHPYVAIMDSPPEIILDTRESQYHFGGKVGDLLNPENLRVTDIKTSYGHIKDVPYFHIHGEIIWGATAAILNELKQILLGQTT